MLVPYPPGIPLIMPGERFTEATRSILDYLEFARTFERAFLVSTRCARPAASGRTVRALLYR